MNHPDDRGGPTSRGVSQKVYDHWRITHAKPVRSVKEIMDEEVAAIYLSQYWAPAYCDKMPEHLGLIHFDAAVNHGVKRANKLLQRAIGVSDDGVIGKKTLAALDSELHKCGESSIVNCYLDIRSDFYDDIAENNPSQVAFIKGWKNRIRSLREEVA